MKTSRFLLVAAIALPMVAVEAQNPPNPNPPPEPIATVFRNRTGNLRRQIAQAYDSIPASKLDYKPTPAQLTFGYIAQHVTEDSYLFCNQYSDAKAPRVASDTAAKDTVRAKWPKDSLVAKMKIAFKFCDDVLRT